ncbi:MAG: tetratricopeptide repeat protein [Planctomycetota bacterium]
MKQQILGLTGEASVGDVTVERVHDSLAQRHDQRLAADDTVGALRFASLAERLYPDERVPARAVERVARAHRAVGEELASTQPRTPEGVIDLRASDPTTLEQVRQHYINAGDRFLRHARMTLLGEPEVSRMSLWEAADAYDNAGDLDRATELFGEFVEATHNDPRQLEGRYRLGKAWLGRGDHTNAIAFFEGLIQDHATSEEAYLSYVPLSRAYLLASDWTDTDRAERLLERVLDGQTFTPDAPEYRAALVELGDLYRKTDRTTLAIERMTEAIERYPELGEDPTFTFDLADANRLSADAIGERLRESMPSAERSRLRTLRIARLDRASDLYERARSELVEEDERTRSGLEEELIRNALIYRADCAFDKATMLARRSPEEAEKLFRQAIRRYDSAAQRYADDPAALSAMMQVVNCYAALGDLRAAQIAHERARERLARLPDSAFEDTSSPFNRAQWERWLESAVELDRFASAAE